MMPKAELPACTSHRLRLRILSRRGDDVFFQDLTSALFAALVIFGISELIRGHWKTPPWYTAFWYAFGGYSKVLLDQAAAQRG
jgi:hypothetical protein